MTQTDGLLFDPNTYDPQQFDAETITLRIRTDVMTLTGNVGLTNRFDVGLAVPFVRMNLQGERVDTYRGEAFFQATGSASSSGLGDMVMRLKYNVFDRGASGVSLGLETRLPTGDEDNLLGSGDFTFAPRFIGSVEGDTIGFHGELSYTLNTDTNTLGYGGALTIAATAGRSRGQVTSRKAHHGDAPRVRAASSSRGSSVDHDPPTVRTTTA